MSHWGPWSPCSKTCDEGVTHRQRKVFIPPQHGGRGCPHSNVTAACKYADCNDPNMCREVVNSIMGAGMPTWNADITHTCLSTSETTCEQRHGRYIELVTLRAAGHNYSKAGLADERDAYMGCMGGLCSRCIEEELLQVRLYHFFASTYVATDLQRPVFADQWAEGEATQPDLLRPDEGNCDDVVSTYSIPDQGTYARANTTADRAHSCANALPYDSFPDSAAHGHADQFADSAHGRPHQEPDAAYHGAYSGAERLAYFRAVDDANRRAGVIQSDPPRRRQDSCGVDRHTHHHLRILVPCGPLS